MDLKYLADRWEKGVVQTTELLHNHQRFIYVDNLSEATGDVIATQARASNKAKLGAT